MLKSISKKGMGKKIEDNRIDEDEDEDEDGDEGDVDGGGWLRWTRKTEQTQTRRAREYKASNLVVI